MVLDRQPGQIENMRRIKLRSYFGDATRSDLLHSAGVDKASLFVVAIDDREQAVDLVHHLKQRHPELKVLARAYDRGHNYRLQDAGADYVVSETFHSALVMGAEVLRMLGYHPFRAHSVRTAFDKVERAGHEELYQMWRKGDEAEKMNNDYLAMFMQLDEAMRETMQRDRSDGHSLSERGWTPPPKGYVDKLSESGESASDAASGKAPGPDQE